MQKTVRHILFVLVFLCFAFPAIQQYFHVFKEIPLHGAYTVPSDSALTWANWVSGDFQRTFTEATNYRIGFRTDFVRTRNQIDYSLFDQPHVDQVVKGKSNYLFRYTSYFVNGSNFMAEELMRRNVLRLKKCQDSLMARGKFMLFVIAPEKMFYYKEYLPHDSILNARCKRHYQLYSKFLEEYQCRYIDLNPVMLQQKGKTPHLIYSKGGFHWTQYGAYLGYDSILNYLRQKTNFSIPNLELQELKTEKTPWDPDVDIYKTCNLFIPLGEGMFTYPQVKTDSTLRTTTAVVSADSYFHAITWSGLFQKTFSPQSSFWYYNREINTPDNKVMHKRQEVDTKELLDKAQLYIVMYSIMNLEKFDYGFLNILEGKE